jgi:hypothetical protein
MLGKCPYCDDGVIMMQKKVVQGRNTKVYTCSNAKFYTEDGECFESVGSCSFRIWGNSLLKYGKRGIGEREVRELLKNGSFVATLHSKRGVEYKKYVIADKEYGITVLFDDEVAV